MKIHFRKSFYECLEVQNLLKKEMWYIDKKINWSLIFGHPKSVSWMLVGWGDILSRIFILRFMNMIEGKLYFSMLVLGTSFSLE